MEFIDIKLLTTAVKYEQYPDESLPEIALVGRSNVGKSSLINCLANRKNMARTSSTPGKTATINFYEIAGKYRIVDLPGYGYAKRSKTVQRKLEQMIQSYILQREQLVNLFVLIDIRHDPQKIDTDFITWLGQSGIPFSIIFTKADKIGNMQKAQKAANKYMDTLKETWEELPPYFVTSSDKALGRDEVLDYIEGINRELTTED